ncbi:MAG: hypothetical protein IJ727_12125, partial [Treponema sp.]|nr:hypothetical protein [Treponema sp.]
DENTVYSIPCYDIDDALEFFSDIIGSPVSLEDLNEDGLYEWTYEGLGSLTFKKDSVADDTLFATIDFNVPVLKGIISQYKFIDYDTFSADTSENSYKGKPYFSAGDVIYREKDKTFWICVRPAGGALQKDKSYWICLNPDYKKLIAEKNESVSFYADGKKNTMKWKFAKNLMSLKTAKAACHTFSLANSALWKNKKYENAENVYTALKEKNLDLQAMESDENKFCFAYGSFTKDKKRSTSGKNPNAFTQYVQPFLIGSTTLDGKVIKEEIWTIRTDTKNLYSATDNYDVRYSQSLGIPPRNIGTEFSYDNFLQFFQDIDEFSSDYKLIIEPTTDMVKASAYYDNQDFGQDSYFIYFSPELMIKDNKGTASEAQYPLDSKYKVIYRSADSYKAWNWWQSLTVTERYVDGKKTDFTNENK